MEKSKLDTRSNKASTADPPLLNIETGLNDLQITFKASPTTIALSSLAFPQISSKPFPFLTLPGEIRNKIYQYTYLSSRFRPPIYNIPDFIVHGDLDPSSNHHGGIRWLNIERFNLLLVCKKINLEVRPAISSLAFFSIKTYHDNSICVPHCLLALSKLLALFHSAHKVFIDFEISRSVNNSGQWGVQVSSLCKILNGFVRLGQVEVKVFVSHLQPKELKSLEPILGLVRRGASVLVVLVRNNGLYCKGYEDVVFKGARRVGGKNAQVWVEWIREKL